MTPSMPPVGQSDIFDRYELAVLVGARRRARKASRGSSRSSVV